MSSNPVGQMVAVIEVVEHRGLPGKAGPQGPAGKSFEFQQPTASATWTIAHHLGIKPSVTTLTLGGIEMEGSVQHLSNDVVIVTFLTPVAGSAHLV